MNDEQTISDLIKRAEIDPSYAESVETLSDGSFRINAGRENLRAWAQYCRR